jgi:hypothetical protein
MHGTVPHSVLTQRSKHFYTTSLTSECQVALCSVREVNASTVAARCFIAVGYEFSVQFHGVSGELSDYNKMETRRNNSRMFRRMERIKLR